jgi:hypothetical protein
MVLGINDMIGYDPSTGLRETAKLSSNAKYGSAAIDSAKRKKHKNNIMERSIIRFIESSYLVL